MTRYPTLSALCLAGVSALLFPVAVEAEETAPPPAGPGPSAATAALTDLETRAPKDWSNPALIAEINAEVIRLVGSNQLATGSDYLRAALLLQKDLGEFRTIRTRYELMLTAAAKGESGAESGLPFSWDAFLSSLGRSMRIDTSGLAASNPDQFQSDPAPASIQAVLRDPAGARTKQAASTDNAEIKTLVDADQEVRKTDWSTLTAEQRQAIQDGDRQRNARIREIIAAGDVRTVSDFARASLVMQHSGRFAGYQLAHELAVCSLLLGDRQTGRWLVTATYDRMLRSVGHDQRFGTQFGFTGLQTVDETGICDAEREALGCPTLAASRARTLRATIFAPAKAAGK